MPAARKSAPPLLASRKWFLGRETSTIAPSRICPCMEAEPPRESGSRLTAMVTPRTPRALPALISPGALTMEYWRSRPAGVSTSMCAPGMKSAKAPMSPWSSGSSSKLRMSCATSVTRVTRALSSRSDPRWRTLGCGGGGT